jgi:hypothetical protein
MASKHAAPGKKGRNLFITPSLSVSSVHAQLEEFAGSKLPRRISRRLAKSHNRQKIREVGLALSRIISNSGRNSDEILKLFRDKSYAQLLIYCPKALTSISESAGEHSKEAFSLFDRIDVARAFSTKPELVVSAFSKLKGLNGVARKYAFKILRKRIGAQFASDPLGTATALAKAARILGRRTKALYRLLKRDEFRNPISEHPAKLVEFAEAASYLNLFSELKRKLKAGKHKEVSSLINCLGDPDMLLRQGMPVLMPIMERFFESPSSKVRKDSRAMWREGRRLSREAGLIIEDREVFFNFAYAQRTIGREKTLVLNEEFGIEYFARYTEAELDTLYEKTANQIDAGPLFIIAHNKYDYSASYYEDYQRRRSLTEDGYYNVIFIEAESEDEFYLRTEKIAREHFGMSRLQIAGHGNSGKIRMGSGSGEENFIDLSDMEQLKRLRGLFAEDALVILSACSTGEDANAIGARLSAAWNVELVAQESSTYFKGYVKDGKKVVGAEYGKAAKKFRNGREIAQPE